MPHPPGRAPTEPVKSPDDAAATVERILKLWYPSYFVMEALAQAWPAAAPSLKPLESQVRAERERLLALPPDTLATVLQQALAREKAEQQARADEKLRKQQQAAAKKEAAKFYNSPAAVNVDYELWVLREYWTFEEALALLLARNPEVVTPAKIRSELSAFRLDFTAHPEPQSEFLRTYERLRKVAERATVMAGPRLNPIAVAVWAHGTGLVQVPHRLAQLIVARARKLQAQARPPTAAPLPSAAISQDSNGEPSPDSPDRSRTAPSATPVPAPRSKQQPAPGRGTVHSTKTRRDALSAVIERAQARCDRPDDPAEVWGQLQAMAEKQESPLLGATEDGIQYLKNGQAANLSRDALSKRVHRWSGRN
jgi:hypothetical protein